MWKKLTVVVIILVMQACVPLVAQTQAPTTEEPDPPGILQRIADRVSEAKAKVQRVGGTVLGFAGVYYEDHIKPVTEPYIEWASRASDSLWEKLQRTINDYKPF